MASSSRVEMASALRLPFEPKEWRLEMRNELREAIASMRAPIGDEILEARYICSDRSLCDVENILFYNVGLASFARSASRGFVLQREFSDEPAFDALRHRCIYSLVPQFSVPRCWRETDTLAKWSFEFNNGSQLSKPERVWFRSKRGALESFKPPDGAGYLAVNVQLDFASETRVKPINLIKPLLDGIISGFHAYEGADLDEVCRRISQRLEGTEPKEIAAMLLDDKHAVLDSRQLVHRFGNGIQWNPADDRCVYVGVTVNNTSSQNRCSGSISMCMPLR